MSDAPPPVVTLDRRRLTALRSGVLLVRDDPVVFRVTGPGALPCLQGLLTNDLDKPGDGSLVYGALLTPKGMIVADLWVLRHAETSFTLLAPARARESTLEIFQRSLPPRLARATEVTDTDAALRVLGPKAAERMAAAGLPLPDSVGRLSPAPLEAGEVAVLRPQDAAPFRALVVGTREAVDAAAERLLDAGVPEAGAEAAEAARILAGWPALGSEIGERTLPQEVRYDEIGGLSYTKGCYTGQETVARLHFRGHTNRELRGLVWLTDDPLEGETIYRDGKDVGRVRSQLRLPNRVIGLATLRREVEPDETVLAGGQEARVVPLPFPDDAIGR